MDRNIFQKRLKRLAVWVLVIAVVACCGQNAGMNTQAAGTMVTLPVTYGTDGQILIDVSGDYTQSVTIDEDAITASVTLPQVEITSSGYVFDNWSLNISGGGYYDPGFQTVFWDSTMPASSVVTYPGALPFTVNYHIENAINVSYEIPEDYKSVAQVEAGVQTEYLESTDGDGLYGKAVITLPEVVESEDNLVFVGWKCYDTGGDGVEIITEGYEENYCESGMDVYPRGVDLEFTYPTDGENEGGNTASYIFEAQFVSSDNNVKVSYVCNPDDELDVDEQYFYQQNIEDGVVAIRLPEGPSYEKYEFLAWYCEERDGAIYEAGDVVELNFGEELSLAALWIDVIYEGTLDLHKDTVYKLAPGKNFKVDGDDTVYVGGNYFYLEKSGTYTFTEQ